MSVNSSGAAALEVLSARSDVKAQKHRWKGAGLSLHHWHDENDESGYVGLALLCGQGFSKPTFQQRPEHFEIAQELEYPYNVTNGGVRDQTLRQNAHEF